MVKRTKEGLAKKYKYDVEYSKKNLTQICLRFNKNTEQDLIKHINTKSNKLGYIKGLIRNDMEKQQ